VCFVTALRRRYLPGAWQPPCSGSIDTNTGDGTLAAQRIGAALGNMDSAWWGPMLSLPDEPRSRLLTFERALPGSIIVNQAGRRYMNEAMAYDLAGRRMVEADVPGAGTAPSWFLFGERYRRRYPVGPLIPGIPVRLHQRGLREILIRADSWDALARRSSSSTGTRPRGATGAWPRKQRVRSLLRRPSGSSKPESRSARLAALLCDPDPARRYRHERRPVD